MTDVAAAYEAMAGPYIKLYDGTDWLQANGVDFIQRHLGVRQGPVLDVGCGPGQVTSLLRSSGVAMVGLDPVPGFVRYALDADPEASFLRGSVLGLPFADASFGSVLSWYSLIHLRPDSVAPALGELRRVVRTGGRLVVGFFQGPELRPFDHAVTTAYYWPIDELADQLRAVGFAEFERRSRPGTDEQGKRPTAALAATAV